jgi:hypothetical protein
MPLAIGRHTPEGPQDPETRRALRLFARLLTSPEDGVRQRTLQVVREVMIPAVQGGVVGELVEVLRRGNDAACRWATEALAAIGPVAAPALLAGLRRGGDPAFRVRLAAALEALAPAVPPHQRLELFFQLDVVLTQTRDEAVMRALVRAMAPLLPANAPGVAASGPAGGAARPADASARPTSTAGQPGGGWSDGLSWGPDSVELYEAGQRAGAAWAGSAATPEELRRLVAFYHRPGTGYTAAFARDRAAPGTCGAEAFHAVVRPKEKGRPGAADVFWRAALDEADRGKEDSGHFSLGFAAGSLPEPDAMRKLL